MGNGNILYIDDDINMLNTGEDILIEAGYDVSLAKSGVQAIKILGKSRDYDLILLDVDMPDMNGYETFKAIRGIAGCENIPIIFLTGMDSPDNEIKGLELGAADYITKPFVKIVLLARIKKEMGKKVETVIAEPEYSEVGLQRMNELLTEQEIVICKLIADGFSNQEIADKTSYSYGYVRKKVSVILDKMYVRTRGELKDLMRK